MRKGLLITLFLLGSQVLLSALPREPRYLVILAQFQDQSFTLEAPASLVRDMLSKQDFNYDGATGSVLDYYKYNSKGAFCPSFDVFGPVTLNGRMLDYGRDVFEQGERVGDIAHERAILEACELVDDQVDFTDYDADRDGYVDLVIVVYAGYNQAWGGKADALWSQQWDVRNSQDGHVIEMRLDGVGLGQYLSVSELFGASGSHLCGIGPVCHELGHFLGLPDFYDTDGSKDGNAGALYGFSLMGNGLYNNDGHTPPTLNALELKMLDWLPESDFQPLPSGNVQLKTVQEGGVYVSSTDTSGEFFLYEYRNGKGWDAPLPEGLVIYRVDQSQRMVGDHKAAFLWTDWHTYNGLNADATHPCFHLIPASHPELLAYDATLATGRMVYPGLDQVLFYEPVDWEGNFTGLQITNIGLEQDAAHFRVLRNDTANINGRVYDLAGRALEGVTVSLEGLNLTAVTDADGFFFLPLAEGGETLFTLLASKTGYLPVTEEVSLGAHRMVSVALTLPGEDDARVNTLSRYDKSAQMGFFRGAAMMGGVRFGTDYLFPYVGQELKNVVFYPYMQPSFDGEVYVVVDLDEERVLTRKVEYLQKGPYFRNEVDLSDAHIVIPEGRELFIGYGTPRASDRFRVGTVYPGGEGNSYYCPFNEEVSSWKPMYVGSLGIYMDVALSARTGEKLDALSLDELGYSYIELPAATLRAGERLPLRVRTGADVSAVNWTLNGVALSSDSVLLTAGTHKLRARLTYVDGRVEVLEVSLEVN